MTQTRFRIQARTLQALEAPVPSHARSLNLNCIEFVSAYSIAASRTALSGNSSRRATSSRSILSSLGTLHFNYVFREDESASAAQVSVVRASTNQCVQQASSPQQCDAEGRITNKASSGARMQLTNKQLITQMQLGQTHKVQVGWCLTRKIAFRRTASSQSCSRSTSSCLMLALPFGARCCSTSNTANLSLASLFSRGRTEELRP